MAISSFPASVTVEVICLFVLILSPQVI